jgi:hypothetical protein
MSNPGLLSQDSPPNDLNSHIPFRLKEQLQDSVPRPLLVDKIETVISNSAASSKQDAQLVLIVGEPGSGKTILAGQLAASWNCPSYFIRIGNTDGVIWKDARSFLVSLGLQLRARYGPEVLGPPLLKVQAELSIGTISEGGKAGGFVVDKLSLSPFQQVLVDIKMTAEELAGEAFLVHIGELADVTQSMSLAKLAQEALLHPLQRLAAVRPDERVRIIVDSLDESLEIAESIPLGAELGQNVVWVLTSRPGDHLDRFIETSSSTHVVQLDLSDPEINAASIDDAERYALVRLAEASMRGLLEASPISNRPIKDLARNLAEASKGNFLYLYHLIYGIQVEAQEGNFGLIEMSPDSILKGLDGIYRYFITNRIRTKEHKRDWIEHYTPVLGALAVARAPLVSTQLAAFSKLDKMIVNNVLGEVRQFLETSKVENDLAYYIYHRSFADFLLTQDQSRNPYPLQADTFYHSAIADYYQSMEDSQWSTSKDRYALIHLPVHLVKAHKLEQLYQLLHGAFGQRRMATIGPAQTSNDLLLAARAATVKGQDELFLRLLNFNERIKSFAEVEWETGCYVLSLLIDDPGVVLERTGFKSNSLGTGIGGSMLPWSGFLVVERLLDLGAATEAREVLRNVERLPWPNYRMPKVKATNMLEGSSFDFILQDDAIAFLSRAAQVDPASTLALTKRLFLDSPQLPNVRTAWREVLRSFLAWRADAGPDAGSTVTPIQCKRLAETTEQLLREGGYIMGCAGVTREFVRLLAHAMPAITDPLWIVNAVMLAITRRLEADRTTQGSTGVAEDNEPDHSPGLWAAVADVLTSILELQEALKLSGNAGTRPVVRIQSESAPKISDPGDQDNTDDSNSDANYSFMQLRDTLAETVEQSASILPPIAIPTVGGYTHRAESLGHLAWALYRAGSGQWQEVSQAALAACRLDAAIPDPSMHAVAQGLSWLRRIPEPAPAAEVEELVVRYKLADRLEDIERDKDGPTANARSLEQQTLESLAQEGDSYTRGRIILSLWRRNAATLVEIESSVQQALQGTNKKRGQQAAKEEQAAFSDLLAEAIIESLIFSDGSWVPEATKLLVNIRTPKRREIFEFDSTALETGRLQNLAAEGKILQLRAEVEARYAEAQTRRDVGDQLSACLFAIQFDPALADRWYSQIKQQLEKSGDLGFAIVYMIEQLKRHQPKRLSDLGVKWIADLPPLERSSPIEYYQLLLCNLLGELNIFKPQLITLLHHFTENLGDELEFLRTEAGQFKKKRKQGKADASEDKPSEDDAWQMLGGLLLSVGHVATIDDDLHAAVEKLMAAVMQALDSVFNDMEAWKIVSTIKKTLESITYEEENPSIYPGPVADLLAELYEVVEEEARKSSQKDEAKEVNYNHALRETIALGLSLAITVKQARPDWAEARFQEASIMWDKMLLREPARAGGLPGMAETIADSLASFMDRDFRSGRERTLFELTQSLIDWCLVEPLLPEQLIEMQARLSQIEDTDLRALLLAPVACGWLRVGNLERASKLAQVVESDYLTKAGFYQQLRSLVRNQSPSDDPLKRKALMSLILDTMLQMPVKGSDDAFTNTLSAWLIIRAKNQSVSQGTTAESSDYLKRMTEWALAVAQEEINGKQSGQQYH